MLGVRGGSTQQQQLLPQIVNLHSEAISNQRNLKKRSLLEEITKNQMSRHVGGGGDFDSSSTSYLPIIVVPTSNTQGNICLANVKSFLQDGSYLTLPTSAGSLVQS